MGESRKSVTTPARGCGSHGDWLAAYERAYMGSDNLSRLPCPSCSQRCLQLVFVATRRQDAIGHGAFWCDNCLCGVVLDRVILPANGRREIAGQEHVPSYRIVPPPGDQD